jgi:hypothetical protein
LSYQSSSIVLAQSEHSPDLSPLGLGFDLLPLHSSSSDLEIPLSVPGSLELSEYDHEAIH